MLVGFKAIGGSVVDFRSDDGRVASPSPGLVMHCVVSLDKKL